MKKGFTHESTYNESKEWYTPRYIFKALNVEFDLDPCSPGHDIVPWIPTQFHYTYLDDGLNKEWFGNCWINPPYGTDTPRWMKRLKEHGNGIALVFARCDTQWFHDYVVYADAICFIKGRIQFVAAKDALFYADGIWNPKGGGCGAGSMLIAFGKHNAEALFRSKLGLTLPVITPDGDVQDRGQFAGEKAGALRADCLSYNENPPHNAESRQGNLFGGKNEKVS